MRPALAIAAAIGALLVGAASVGSKDAPRESPLFVLTQVLWPSRVASVASADQVDAILLEARTAIQDGRTQDAQLALLRAAVVLGSVDDVDGKGDRQEVVAALWVEVAPQPSSTGTEPHSAAGARPTTPGTRSAAASSTQNTPLAVLAAPATDSTTAAAQPAGAQVAAPQSPGPQIVPPAASTAGSVQAALGPGWPTAVVTPPPVDGPAVTESAATSASTSAAPVVPVVTAPPVEGTTATPPSVPSTPPPPTVPVDPPAEVGASEPPLATEQSPPAPTPLEPRLTVETTAADSAGAFSSTETAAVNELDSAAASTG